MNIFASQVLFNARSSVLSRKNSNNSIPKFNYTGRRMIFGSTLTKPTSSFKPFSLRGYTTCEWKDDNEYVGSLNFFDPTQSKKIPVYQVLDTHGKLIAPAEDPKLGDDELVQMYSTMLKVNLMDTILYKIQRQGSISFYMTAFGEEATHIGSAKALSLKDTLFLQYREQGVLLWRGFSIEQCINQCLGNVLDLGKGRQMPVHYGSKELNVQTISSPLATQIPQAVGSAYAQKHTGLSDACTVCYFGEGAASEGDFHAGMNFAAALSAPVIFFCRNNKYAISTPSSEQFRGDGIASRAIGYGMKYIRVDGNDILAVYNATKAAREITLSTKTPILIEAMTYRAGHHSTSDDSTRYRSVDEINQWQTNNNPILRFKSYLVSKNLWDDTKEHELSTTIQTEILTSLSRAEARKKPPLSELFNDVYEEIPEHLKKEKEELHLHLQKQGIHYPINEFAPEP